MIVSLLAWNTERECDNDLFHDALQERCPGCKSPYRKTRGLATGEHGPGISSVAYPCANKWHDAPQVGKAGGGCERAGGSRDAAPDTRLESDATRAPLPGDAGSTPARQPSEPAPERRDTDRRLRDIVEKLRSKPIREVEKWADRLAKEVADADD